MLLLNLTLFSVQKVYWMCVITTALNWEAQIQSLFLVSRGSLGVIWPLKKSAFMHTNTPQSLRLSCCGLCPCILVQFSASTSLFIASITKNISTVFIRAALPFPSESNNEITLLWIFTAIRHQWLIKCTGNRSNLFLNSWFSLFQFCTPW